METVQGTPAWFKARQGKLTASRFGAAAGVCPFASRNKTLKEITGKEEWKGSVEACQWGTMNERNAIKDYMIRTGNVVRSKGFFTHPDYEWLGGSPDGLVGDEGIIEVKCPFYHKVPHERIPPHYLCQVNGLMQILDKQWCDFISWTPSAMRIYRVYRDEALWAYLLEHYTIFYACMRRGCEELPRFTQKAEVLARIAESDQATDYGFWRGTEPAALGGKWEAPPVDEFSSKRELEDEPDEVQGLPRRIRFKLEIVWSGPRETATGNIHSAANEDVPKQLEEPRRLDAAGCAKQAAADDHTWRGEGQLCGGC